jgi:hypothetical protein
MQGHREDARGDPVIRPTCGTKHGFLEHQAASEWPCGWCIHAERVARLTAERLAPAVSPGYAPVTPDQAAVNARVLDHEVAGFDADHRGEARHRWLRLAPEPLSEAS